jgi:hypothetical protein
MPDTTIFAYTESVNDYPAYINLKRTDAGKCLLTVRSRGNGGRDQGCIEVSPETLESLQCDLCEWLYRDDVAKLTNASEAEVDAELRRLGIDPEDAARRGKQAAEGALRTAREVAELRWIVNAFLEWQEGNPCPEGLIERARAAVPNGVTETAQKVNR